MSAIISQNRRITILRYLAETSGYMSNISILGDVCSELGVLTSRDQCQIELHWLAEQGFVTLGEDGYVVTATARGVDIAKGRATVPGIKRPAPEA